MKAHIRFAKITDSASILMLIQELAEFEKEPESVKLTLSDIENFGFGTQPLFQCLVAEINNQVVDKTVRRPACEELENYKLI